MIRVAPGLVGRVVPRRALDMKVGGPRRWNRAVELADLPVIVVQHLAWIVFGDPAALGPATDAFSR